MGKRKYEEPKIVIAWPKSKKYREHPEAVLADPRWYGPNAYWVPKRIIKEEEE
tara:strand:- start:1229 stop:1387 length:159 start_codon:yes stop_codon:yes gene_type:complete